MLYLPQELVDRIIDEFYDSFGDLKNLSLVARSWLHRARCHLFRSLTLNPQDLQAIRDHYADLKRRDSLDFILDPDDYVSLQDKKFLCSPLAENPQPTQSFLSSITNIIPHVRGLQLLSWIQVGDQLVPAKVYHREWLGYGGDAYASHCRLRRSLSSNEDFLERQKVQWNSIDLPWERGTGLHALPFRNLRLIYIQWSVFSWTLPFERTAGPANPANWPGIQLALLLKSNGSTLDHVHVTEYPGFQPDKNGSTRDALLNLLAQNAPNLRSLCLGGLRKAYYPQFRSLESEDPPLPDRVLYPSGEEVPHIILDHNCPPDNLATIYLERLFLQGFEAESTILIQEAMLNGGVFSLKNLSHLVLSVMPMGYDYMFMFSKVQGTLTHLTLDLKDSTLYASLRFHFFPRLAYLQFIVHAIYRSWVNLHDIVRALSDNAYHLDGSLPVIQLVKRLHISYGSSARLINHGYLLAASADELLESLVCIPSEIPESMGRSQVEEITFDVSESMLADTFPLTYSTGRLKEGQTDHWWYRPSYVLSLI
ncbi:hypothetical protein C8R42DRAFT_685219 [Lentinula raphanica]|nr:hypothetical protein C8R42DRAFT_685219 [Lentinula raphanica]